MPRAILFDLFGVIALPQTPDAKRRIEEIAGVEPEALWDAYWALRKPYDAGQPSAEYWAAVADRVGVRFTSETIRALIEADLASWTDVDPAMVSLLGELAGQERTLGLLSNIIADLVPVFEERHGPWLAHFDALTYSCAIGVAKPDHRAFEIAAEHLGVAPADCLFIDDTEVNVLAAREVGMRAEVFHSPDQARDLTAG
ncbi:HAD family phosphatase [Actinoallomurus purpureus]|uniref:HAD family hydrolase n=1 Tax=Actinoallomurus purpureus TaxID=478114 RepID=UPI002092DFA9|nr:HAD family phosphatase [Actinoallomurus purpureus]MCO6006503.1 HAD family phosphatase [Actinoallomurus purpureus]